MDLWQEIAASQPALWVKTSVWVYPILETVHVVGLGLLFGGIFAMDLRLMGLSRVVPVLGLARHLLPWVWFGFAINAMSGLLLFVSGADEFAGNTAFRIKMILIALAGLNAFVFHRAFFKNPALWDGSGSVPAGGQVAACLSILLWLGVMTAGRMIAYVE